MFLFRCLRTTASNLRFSACYCSCSCSSLYRRHNDGIGSYLLLAIESSATLFHLKQTHALLLRLGLDQCNIIITKLILRFTDHKIPMHTYPHLIFSQVHHPNPFLWSAVIRGYALLGPSYTTPFSMYSLMRRLHPSTSPISFTFSALLKLARTVRSLHAGSQLHAQIILIGGFDSDLFVQNCLIDMYIGCGELESARRLFDGMGVRDVVCWTMMVVGYFRAGEMSVAKDLFERSPVKDPIAWTAMITGYAQKGRPKDALRLFERMREEGIDIDEIMLSTVISSCAQLGVVTQATRIAEFVEENGFGRDVVVGSALVDMFCKCGLVDEAMSVFDGMKKRNVYTYSAMIAGLAAHGCACDAIRLFEDMVTKSVVMPNDVTFVGLLTACSHAGMVEEGLFYFDQITDKYGITRTVNHYACMTDLLGRAGRVEEAYELVQSMPMDPHGGVWGALLGACQIHVGHVGIAEIAAKHLFKLEPDGIGNYVLLSNIYASAGMWERVLKLRKLMRWKNLKKDPAHSLIETKDGVVHEFFMDDGSHPRTREIKEALEDLMRRLKLAGYVPNLSLVPYDVSDTEKEHMLMGHSEKLALAFGLLTTGVNEAIRIVKNIQICVDCHMAMCLASSVMKKEIIVRDNVRFHHFHDGHCSCAVF